MADESIPQLDLLRPDYHPAAAYGHFGRNDLGLQWEAFRLPTKSVRFCHALGALPSVLSRVLKRIPRNCRLWRTRLPFMEERHMLKHCLLRLHSEGARP